MQSYNDIKITKSSLDLEKYDMYYIEAVEDNGGKIKLKIFLDKGTFTYDKWYEVIADSYKQDYIQQALEYTGEHNRTNYAYLGVEDPDIFEADLNELKGQNEANKEHKNGKKYVLGDIHGMYGSYIEAMKSVNNNDTVYIIGDVIDRGENGIKILQDIIKRKADTKNNPDIVFLLGNHEEQFLETISVINKYGLDVQDMSSIINRGKYAITIMDYKAKRDNEKDLGKRKIIEDRIAKLQRTHNKLEEHYKNNVKTKNIPDDSEAVVKTWINMNGGVSTIEDYYELTIEEQKSIAKFMCEADIAVTTKVNDRNFILVHAMPPGNPEVLEKLKREHHIGITDQDYLETHHMLSDREDDRFGTIDESKIKCYKDAKKEGFITICGHTPQKDGKILKNDECGYIRIDTNCGHKSRNSKLSLYCIDDDTVKYIDEMENINSKNPSPDPFER